MRWLRQLTNKRSEGTETEDMLILNIGGFTTQTFSLVQTDERYDGKIHMSASKKLPLLLPSLTYPGDRRINLKTKRNTKRR